MLTPGRFAVRAARRYNRIRRWLGIADFVIGFVFLVVLLATRWSDSLRDLAYRLGFQNYTLSLLMYIVLLLGISKLLIDRDFRSTRLLKPVKRPRRPHARGGEEGEVHR